MAKEQLERFYVENVLSILQRLARYKTRRASFVYKRSRHSWLDRGLNYALERSMLVEALRLLGVPFEEDRRRKRSIITVLDTDLLRERLSSVDLETALDRAYRAALSQLWGRQRRA